MSAAVQAAPGGQSRSNLKVAMIALAVALGMLGLGYASVPLYRMFCQVTGLGGTTQRVDALQASMVAVSAQTISVRFDANTAPGLPWDFRPEKPTTTVQIGERQMATYLAKNTSGQPITGIASYNVTPVQAGKYFDKVQCFCFNEQTLQPGQEVRMPVLFYVEQITLSYTFYESTKS